MSRGKSTLMERAKGQEDVLSKVTAPLLEWMLDHGAHTARVEIVETVGKQSKVNVEIDARPSGCEDTTEGAERMCFDRRMNALADAELLANPGLRAWADEWLRLNFGDGLSDEEPILETCALDLRRVIVAAYAKGRNAQLSYAKGERHAS